MLHKEKLACTTAGMAPTVPVDIDEVTMMRLSSSQPTASKPAQRPKKRQLIDVVNRGDAAFYAQATAPKQGNKNSNSLPRIRRYRKIGGNAS